MFIACCFCDWKCCTERDIDKSICQNSEIAKQPNIEIPDEEIVMRYLSNKITSAIIFGGLEPIKQIDEVTQLIKLVRDSGVNDDIVIYTGYYPDEIQNEIHQLKQFQNIVVKFGRYIPNSKSVYDKVLGVNLVSENQYAIKIS
jgi:hypothetical protein